MRARISTAATVIACCSGLVACASILGYDGITTSDDAGEAGGAGAGGTSGGAGATGGAGPNGTDAGADAGPPDAGPNVAIAITTGSVGCAVYRGKSSDDPAAGGSLYCWGAFQEANLTTTPQAVRIKEVGSDVIAVAATYIHVDDTQTEDTICVVHATGTVSCGGGNQYGELGRGEALSDQPFGWDDVTLPGPAVDVVAADETLCARLESGAMYCWGNNGGGTLGNGTYPGTDDASVNASALPIEIFDGGVIDISAGFHNACAAFADGGVSCWGSNEDGRLGHPPGTNGDQPGCLCTSTPSHVSILLSPGETIARLVEGNTAECVYTSDGNTRCWGSTFDGFFGTTLDEGGIEPVRTPIPPPDDPRSFAATAGLAFCVVSDGGVQCRGDDLVGAIGPGESRDAEPFDRLDWDHVPVLAFTSVPLPSRAVRVFAGLTNVVAATDDGRVFTWGKIGTPNIDTPILGRTVDDASVVPPDFTPSAPNDYSGIEGPYTRIPGPVVGLPPPDMD